MLLLPVLNVSVHVAQVSRTASLASATSTAEDDDNQVDGGAELSRRDSLERQTRVRSTMVIYWIVRSRLM